MDDFVKYTTKNNEDKNWGLYVNVAGCATIEPGASYPPPGHPSEYNFSWENGRILHEFQLNYITKGEGVLETRNEKYHIKEGSVIFTLPGLWHRYRPSKLGWKEHYIGFNGIFATNIFENEFLKNQIPVVHIGYNDKLLNEFYELRHLIEQEKPGYQQIASGLVIYILSSILSIKRNENFGGKLIEQTIQKACLIIRENIDKNMNVEHLAKELNIDYSIFRKMFKEYKGISPGQYHLSLRISQAKDLLINTNLSIKEISYRLGFESIFYFSRVFKSKTGITPTEYRQGPQTLKHF